MLEENKDKKEDLKQIKALLKQEIAKRNKLEEKLRTTLEELNRSNKEHLFILENLKEAYNRAEFYKDLFTHDINNILQGILSGMELCGIVFDDPDEIKATIKVIKAQVKRGAGLVSNIRKLSQLEKTEISLKRTEICNSLKNSIDYAKTTYQDKKMNIKVDSMSKQLYVRANELIRDVFENILINAIRHNKSSIPEIDVKISKYQKLGINYLKIEFQDNGVGIVDTRKEKIFQRGENKRIHGMGLGLSLVKKIIDIYNGEIWVEDKVIGDHSKGSNFVILIPEVD